MATLVFVDPASPGLGRIAGENGFAYADHRGKAVRDERTLKRIASLVIPPAWRDVWICKKSNGHIQAIGVDERGRRQYRYHPQFRADRDEAKFTHIIAFAKLLPALRQRIEADMSAPGLGYQKVVATIVHLLETTMIRVGNTRYARENKTYGLSTLRNRHTTIEGSTLRFAFKGKSGKQWSISVRDRRAARIVKACQQLPGQHLFQYLDEDGDRRSIDSRDVNAYLKVATGKSISAKDFRTWAGTVLCAIALGNQEIGGSASAVKRQIAAAVRDVATRLGNTPAICRACYIHPEIVSAFSDGALVKRMKKVLEKETEHHELRPEESAVLALLAERLRAIRRSRRETSGAAKAANEPPKITKPSRSPSGKTFAKAA